MKTHAKKPAAPQPKIVTTAPTSEAVAENAERLFQDCEAMRRLRQKTQVEIIAEHSKRLFEAVKKNNQFSVLGGLPAWEALPENAKTQWNLVAYEYLGDGLKDLVFARVMKSIEA